MCFSATASFSAGLVVGGLGAATLPFVRDRRQLAFASLPLIFGVHQILEGVIWTQLDDTGGEPVRTTAVVLWLFIAWTVLPILVPLAVARFEPDRTRRRAMYVLAGVGVAIGTFLLVASIVTSTAVRINGHHLQYLLPLDFGWAIAVPYVAATCLPLLLSSHRFVVRFGVAMAAAMAVTTLVDALEFSSVWCFFAAVLSAGLLVHYLAALRSDQRLPIAV